VQQSSCLASHYSGRTAAVSLGRLADVYLFVTNDCNLRCTHCYVSSGDYLLPREMATDEIFGLIDQARYLGATRFLVTGGEPFMVRDIYDISRRITAENRSGDADQRDVFHRAQHRSARAEHRPRPSVAADQPRRANR
jgi:sulfatase maturation enzyme AslB (radical SAM superfamily)